MVMNSKKKIYIIIAIVVAVIVLVVCLLALLGVFKRFKTPEAELQWRLSQEKSVANAIAQGDAASCDKISYVGADGTNFSQVCRDNIALSMAKKSGDVSQCASISGQGLHDLCLQAAANAKLVAKPSQDSCDTIADATAKNYCLNDYWLQEAVLDDKIQSCSNISDKVQQTVCADQVLLSQLIKNPSAVQCTAFQTSLQADCTSFKNAMNEKDSAKSNAWCENIKDIRLKEVCK